APNCEGCLLRTHCVYSTLFESPPTCEQTAQRYSALPHPFVLEPPPAGQREIPPGEPLQLGLTLIGRAGDQLPYLIHALQRAGERGLGREGGRFRLFQATQEATLGGEDWQRVFVAEQGRLEPLRTAAADLGPAPDSLAIQLLTPLRLKRHGHYLRPQQLDAQALLGTLLTRVALLYDCYEPAAERLQQEPLRTAIDQLRLEQAELRWVDWTRYSSRQGTHMQLGGLLGRFRLRGPGLPALWPLVVLGQWLHVGKNTSFGLGRYRLAPDQTTRD
ncbi:MAG: CRISPR system precrRNA processing endoribonuclease RAMP protein Cas6, partial [Lamprobacter sp.]|uniref:CRISPR system precrRNA processing endoribonuclease RAMP protein Cas6 n=1 Tax=Lamprobacter sp. TaxID=3100796 RepID=UPI002B263F05